VAEDGKKGQASAADSETRVSRRKPEAVQPTLDDGQIALLRRQYRSLTGKAAHASVPRFVLARAVTYERQVREHGGLSPRVLSALAAVAKEDLGPPGRNITSSEAGSLVAPPGIRPGTILVREHQNVLHRVIAIETGFTWNGRTFASLSATARAITGVRWNGRRFFGLQEKPIARLPKSTKEQDKVAP
jgi:Protein of unknown function (DUF2924)